MSSPISTSPLEPKEWYVRLENIHVNDSYVGYKRIITNSNLTDDIKQSIIAYYSLSPSLKPHLRIWSSPFRSKRLDHLESIPLQYDFLSIYLL